MSINHVVTRSSRLQSYWLQLQWANKCSTEIPLNCGLFLWQNVSLKSLKFGKSNFQNLYDIMIKLRISDMQINVSNVAISRKKNSFIKTASASWKSWLKRQLYCSNVSLFYCLGEFIKSETYHTVNERHHRLGNLVLEEYDEKCLSSY